MNHPRVLATLLCASLGSSGLLACSEPKAQEPTPTAPVALPAKEPAVAPAPAVAAAVAAAQAVPDAAVPARKPVAVVAAPLAPVGPPRKHVKGAGIELTETSDGRVILKTTATWGEPLDTTYSDCSYYMAALPVIRTQVSAARAKLLDHVCTKTKSP